MMLTACTTTQALTLNNFISLIHDYASSNQNNTPFTLEYDPSNGVASGPSAVGRNR